MAEEKSPQKPPRRSSRPKGGLGSSLDDLLGISYTQEPTTSKNTFTVRISYIEPNRSQPRKLFLDESMEELAESIRQNGVITPIALRKTGEDRYRIIAGERRWRAARMAGLLEVPAIVLDADDEACAVMSLTENLQREDLNPVDEAEGIRTLIETFSLTQEECSRRIGRSRPAIANAMRLLLLEEEILERLRDGTLSGGHGRTLLAMPAGEERIALAKEAISGNWSVHKLEDEIKRRLTSKEVPPKTDFDYAAALSERLTGNYGRGVKIVAGKKKGKLELEYYGNEDLEQLLSLLDGVLSKQGEKKENE